MAKKKDFTEEVMDFQNQMQEIREQMNALVSNADMNYVEFKQNKTKVGMKKKEETDSVAFGDCTFKISVDNNRMLSAFSKYAMMLDFVTHSQGEDSLSIEAFLNMILYDGMKKLLKDLVKRHGFYDLDEFMNCMMSCSDGEEVSVEIRKHESAEYQKLHDDIMSHIPVEDKQNKFDFAK